MNDSSFLYASVFFTLKCCYGNCWKWHQWSCWWGVCAQLELSGQFWTRFPGWLGWGAELNGAWWLNFEVMKSEYHQSWPSTCSTLISKFLMFSEDQLISWYSTLWKSVCLQKKSASKWWHTQDSHCLRWGKLMTTNDLPQSLHRPQWISCCLYFQHFSFFKIWKWSWNNKAKGNSVCILFFLVKLVTVSFVVLFIFSGSHSFSFWSCQLNLMNKRNFSFFSFSFSIFILK